MTSATAATQTASLAPWLDHRLFMDEAFAQTHEAFAKVIQEELPDAKVGWDGLLGYHWLAGYDFTQLCSPVLQLNQTYTTQLLQGELVRSFKAPGALTGKWGNADADNADGFAAWPWTCLLTGDNSVWWWTSWGCDYIPFNPDLSLSAFGEWFFAAVREVTAGPGRLLLQARRLDSGIGVLYSQPDMLVTTLLEQMGAPKEIAGAGRWQQEHTAALKLLHDLGYEYRHLSWRELEAGRLPGDGLRLVVLTGAVCVSDRQAAALRAFVEAGGILLCDGRAGLLSGAGRLREAGALDDLLGVTSPAGRAGLTEPLSTATLSGEAAVDGLAKAITVNPPATPVRLLSPGLRLAGAAALWSAGETPVGAVRRLGRGCAITTNIPWSTLAGDRLADDPQPLRELAAALLEASGIEPPARLRRSDGTRPKASRLTLFESGTLRYLAVEQDLRLPHLAAQPAHLTLPEAAMAYDLRAGRALAPTPSREWDLVLSRGRPLVFALLPYAVNALRVEAPASAPPGAALKIGVSLETSAPATGFHVVRLDVFAPGATTPHRQYSRNLDCPNGRGQAEIPFALNDPSGPWRLELRDVATGTRAEAVTVDLRP